MTKVPLSELPEFVRNVRAVLKLLPPKHTAVIVALVGELGAGKTTFVQALAKELGVVGAVQSPTYVLMKSYPLPADRTQFGSKRRFTKLVHIDAYRLQNAREFAALRPAEFLNEPTNLICIEWPERVVGALPEPDLIIKFSSEGAVEGERFIEIEK